MRFVCESCQTRYVVPDDRIRGRTLKVRCKKCGNLILLKAEAEARTSGSEPVLPAASAPISSGAEAAARADEVTQMVDAAAQRKLREQWQKTAATSTAGAHPSGEEQLEWHVILPQGQLGPLPLSDLIQKMVSGEMPPRAYVWRDGMADWKRADQVPEVSRWLPALRPTPTPASGTPAGARTTSGFGAAAAMARRVPEEPLAEQAFESGESAAGSTPLTRVPHDPLAGVASAPDLAAAKPGELTRFFITQAHVSRGRSPWAVVAFGTGAAVLLVGGLLGLAQLGVPVPLVPQGSGNEPKIFTGPQGDAKIRDMLLGRRKPQPAGAGGAASPRAAAQGQADPGSGQAQGPLAKRAEQHVDQLGKSDKDQLSRLYASQDLSTLKLKPTQSALPVLDRPDAPLTPEQVSRTIAKFQTGYTRCIDSELKRNPNFQGGKIRIVTTIMSSGLVRQAQIVSDDQRLQRSVAGGPLGSCLSEQTRRMVFPSFQGDPFDAEIPLVLSSAL
jgi:predicted Zn finger-like uncharacterized protein